MTLAQQLKQEGLKEGEQRTKVAIAKNLLAAGDMTPQAVQKLTGLSEQEVIEASLTTFSNHQALFIY